MVHKKHLITEIIKAGFIVGTLDILSAFLFFFIKTGNINVLTVLRFVASGIFGKNTFSGSNWMLFAGLLCHYFIAFSFTIFFFLIYPKLNFLTRNKILTGTLYGILIWTVMNVIVVPLSNVGHRPFSLVNSVINAIILIICIGIPLSFMAFRFYKPVHS